LESLCEQSYYVIYLKYLRVEPQLLHMILAESTTLQVTLPPQRQFKSLFLYLQGLPFFSVKNTQNDQKPHSYKDNAQFHSAFLATMLSYASHFRQNRGVIENFEYLDEFEEDFQKCWLYCVLYLLVVE
jgi:hypothetical protein